MINFYKMHYELDSFFSVSSFKLHFISAKFEDFFADLETLAPTTSTQKQRGTVKCNSAATFCFTEQKISRGKKSHSEKPICKLVLSKSVEHYCNKVLYGLKNDR